MVRQMRAYTIPWSRSQNIGGKDINWWSINCFKGDLRILSIEYYLMSYQKAMESSVFNKRDIEFKNKYHSIRET